jgi:hypothetical protein
VEDFEVRHRLDLCIKLLDTTTGKSITERNVKFLEEGKVVPFIYKGSGIYILMNTERKDTMYEIHAYGYEVNMVSVAYGESNRPYQMAEVSLIPEETAYSYMGLLTMEGSLEGIEELMAIRLTTVDRTLQNYDVRKRILYFFGGAELTEKEYGLFHRATMDFEVFQVGKVIDKKAAILRRPLEMPYAVKDPIVRIVKGKVMPDYSYRLRVRDDGQEVIYLVRYVVKGETYFQKVNFKKEEERKLGL